MEKFIVSARKYRPQNFNTVVGQQHITTTLKNAIRQDQLAHAFLFCGPRGVGKTTCARILAKTINCESVQPDGEACNQCHSCQSFESGISLNIHELDAASNNSVDDIRDLVEQVRYPPVNGQYKIYIVDEVHMLSTAAFNAFLKTLEEPPAYAKFILATTEKHKLLPTILSRCQIFDFRRITMADVVAHLQEIARQEQVAAEKSSLQVVAQKSEGCMRDALSLFDKLVTFTGGQLTYANTLENLNILDDEYFFRLLEALRQQQLPQALLLFDEINRRGFEGEVVLSGFAECMRNLLVARTPETVRLLDVLEGMHARYEEMAGKLSVNYLVSALHILGEAEQGYKASRNRRLHVELCLIRLAYLQQALNVVAETHVPGAKTSISARKRMDSPVALHVKYMSAAALPIGEAPVESLIIEKPVPLTAIKLREIKNAPAAKPVVPTTPPPSPSARALTAMPVPAAPLSPLPPLPAPQVAAPAPGFPAAPARASLLDKLQQKLGSAYEVAPVRNPMPLQMETLQTLWLAYADELESQNKHSAANTFRTAPIALEDENRFVVTVNSRTAKSWIDAERTLLLQRIQDHFFNRSIGFKVVQTPGTGLKAPLEKTPGQMNNQEKYERLIARYPELKVLADLGIHPSYS